MVRIVEKLRREVYQYTAFFDRNELGGYTVTVPALPGLVTEGADLEHARSMAEDAIRCYIEGLQRLDEPPPVESDAVQLRLSVS
jgi:predicted RNase H-like HicB family nuclease